MELHKSLECERKRGVSSNPSEKTSASSSKLHELLEPVRARLRDLLQEGRQEEAIELVVLCLAQLHHQNTELMLKLDQIQRERLGKRSEQISPNQLSLLMELLGESSEEEERVDREATEAENETLTQDRAAADAENGTPPKQKPRRRRPSKDLPREVIVHELSEEERVCTSCHDPMPSIGADVIEKVELIPAQFVVQEHHRLKYACGRCKDTVKTAPGADQAIEKGLPGPGLLAHVVVSKYEQHLPLTRLVQIYERGGFETSVSTLCGWVAAVTDQVKPIVDLIWKQLLSSTELQTDASGLKVLDHDDPAGIRKGTMWCYVGDRKQVVFKYAPDGSGELGPWKYLAGREGYVQADGANIFDRLYNGGYAQASEVGCWSHARRKYYDLIESDPRVAYPLQLIGQLYRVEDLADRRQATLEERLALRRARSRGVTERYRRWLSRTLAKEPPASALAKACSYSVNQWTALTRFLEDARLPLDTNLCESQIRSLAVGRRNYLFAGSDAGAERAAILYSLLRTCALHGVDAFAYLKDVLEKIAAGWSQLRLDELLPENWSPTEPANADASPELAQAAV